MLVRVLLLATLPLAFLSAATISGTVTCSIPGQTTTANSPGSCSVQSGSPFTYNILVAAANSTATFSFLPSTINFSLDAMVALTGEINAGSIGSSSAVITETIAVTTAGPVRPGYLSLYDNIEGAFSGSWEIDAAGFTLAAYEGCYFVACVIPVTLGTTFDVQVSAGTSLLLNQISGYGTTSTIVSGGFSILEANQSTPVAYTTDVAAPEPKAMPLAIFGLFIVAAWRYKIRSKGPHTQRVPNSPQRY